MVKNFKVFAHCAEGELVEIYPKNGSISSLSDANSIINEHKKVNENVYFSVVAVWDKAFDGEIKVAIGHLLDARENDYYVQLSNGYMLTLSDFSSDIQQIDLTTQVELFNENFDFEGAFAINDYVNDIFELLQGYPLIDEMTDDIENLIISLNK